MPKRWLGPGEEDMWLRLAFLWTLLQEAPEVVEELEEIAGAPEVVEELEEIAEKGRRSKEALKAVTGALVDWADKWHLTAEWLIKYALEMLIRSRTGLGVGKVWLSGLGTSFYPPQPVELVIRWDPSIIREEPALHHEDPTPVAEHLLDVAGDRTVVHVEYTPERVAVTLGGASRKAARKAAEKAWRKYADLVEKRYREAGFMPPKDRRRDSSIEDRLAWVVRHVVLGETYKAIADGHHPPLDWRGVARHVKDLAKRLDLRTPSTRSTR